MLPDILIGVIAFVVALVIGIPVGVLYRKKVAEKEIISAEEEMCIRDRSIFTGMCFPLFLALR